MLIWILLFKLFILFSCYCSHVIGISLLWEFVEGGKQTFEVVWFSSRPNLFSRLCWISERGSRGGNSDPKGENTWEGRKMFGGPGGEKEA